MCEPYQRLHAPGLSASDRIRLVPGTALTDLLAVTNVVGIPLALVVALSIAIGLVSHRPADRTRRLQRSRLALPQRSGLARGSGCRSARGPLGEGRLLGPSNPFAHALSLTLSAVPIGLAFSDVVRATSRRFGLTPAE